VIPAKDDIIDASRFYARVLRLYPNRHREVFGKQMMQTFLDSYHNAARTSGRVSLGFWLAVLWDEGRSILREQTSGPEGRGRVRGVLIGLLVIWSFTIVAIPPALAPAAWPVLLVPTVAWCGVFLAAPGMGGAVAKAATLVTAAGVTALEVAVGQRVHDLPDLVSLALMLICILFFVKALAGWSRPRSKALAVWTPAEVAFGLLIGAVGALALKAGASTQVDYDSVVNAVFFGLIPIVCGIAGFVIGRQQPDAVAAACAAMTSFLLGAVLWAAARPLFVEVGLPGNISGWRHVITAVVLIDGIFAVTLALLGQVARPKVGALSD
jgi:hypothetical protein